jgi:hypothetical protein
MGQVNICYISAALLHLHPGMKADDFVHELNKIHYSGAETDYHKDWRYVKQPESHSFHHGIFGLAHSVLCLRNNGPHYVATSFPSYEPVQDWPQDRHDMFDCDPHLTVHARQGPDGNWLSPSYSVKQLVATRLGEPQQFDGPLCTYRRDIKKGKQFWFSQLEPKGVSWRIKEVHEVSKKQRERQLLNARLTVEPILPVFETTEYPDLESLAKAHPDYTPSSYFDWSQEQGIIDAPLSFVNRWGWVRKGDKYFLDDQPPSSRGYCNPDKDESHYTSIIITAEAIKAKAWGFFGFHGYEQTWRFLVDCPSAYSAHQQAVFDWWMNENAVRKGMTVSEHMRQRLLAGAHTPRPQLDDRTALSLVFNHGLGRYFQRCGKQPPFEPDDAQDPACPF